MNNPPHNTNFWQMDESTRGSYNTLAPLPHNRTWSSYPNKCEICKKTCKTILDLKDHYKSEHGKFCGFKCVDCGVNKIPWFHMFVDHVREHRPELVTYCPICDIKIIDPNHINYRTESCLGRPQHFEYKGKIKTYARETNREKRRTAKKYKHFTRKPAQRPTFNMISTTEFADRCDYITQLPALSQASQASPRTEKPASPVNQDGGDEVLHQWAEIFLANGHRF